jgi:hypothetical protein
MSTEKVKLNVEKLKSMADQIENIRLELWSCSNIDDEEDKMFVDGTLFSIQSKLRYDIMCVLEYYAL